MYKSMYVALSGALAVRARLDTVANNLANMNTPGFKSDSLAFESYLKKQEAAGAPNPKGLKSADKSQSEYVVTSGQYTDFSQGPVRITSAPLDMALDGSGFFSVMTYDGERYTRDGSFTVGKDGELVTSDGWPVLSDSDSAIYVNDGVATVDAEGNVWVSGDSKDTAGQDGGGSYGAFGRLAGRIKLVDFAKPYSLVKQGGGLYKPMAPGQMFAPTNTKVIQGGLEGSNVNMIRQMTAMIETQRMSETFTKAIQASDQMTATLIVQVGRAR